jgi:hypothetical protein
MGRLNVPSECVIKPIFTVTLKSDSYDIQIMKGDINAKFKLTLEPISLNCDSDPSQLQLYT